MSNDDYHRVFNNRVDSGAKSEAIDLLLNSIVELENDINTQIRRIKSCTMEENNNSLRRISNTTDHVMTLVKKFELQSTKLYRLQHEKTRFSFFNVCPRPDHRKVMIAGESYRESPEDRSVIIKEVLVARKLAQNRDALVESNNDPRSNQENCIHPRSAREIAKDIRENKTVNGWFGPRPPNLTTKQRQMRILKRPIGLAASRKRKLSDYTEVDIGLARKVVKIRLLPKN